MSIIPPFTLVVNFLNKLFENFSCGKEDETQQIQAPRFFVSWVLKHKHKILLTGPKNRSITAAAVVMREQFYLKQAVFLANKPSVIGVTIKDILQCQQMLWNLQGI